MKRNNDKKAIIQYIVENPITIHDKYTSKKRIDNRYSNIKIFSRKFVFPVYLIIAFYFFLQYLIFKKFNIENFLLSYFCVTLSIILTIYIFKNERELFYNDKDNIGLKENYIARNIIIIKELNASFDFQIQRIELASNGILYFGKNNISCTNVSRIEICNNIIILFYEDKKGVNIKIINNDIDQVKLLKSVGLSIDKKVHIDEIDEKKINDYLNRNIHKQLLFTTLTIFIVSLYTITVISILYGFFVD